jgi:hypothetical protein
MTETTVPPDPATRPRADEPLDFGRASLFLPLVLAGVFSAPGPALGVGRWLLVVIVAAAVWAAAKALVPATGERAGRPTWPRHLAAGVALALAPLVGLASAHPDLAYPWGAVWLAGFALAWGAGLDVIHAVRVGESADAGEPPAAPPAYARALDLAAWLHRAAEVCLVPATARIMESVGQPLPTLPAVAAFSVWIVVVALLHLERKRAGAASPAAPGATVAVSAAVLVLVLVVRVMSRGGS